MAQDRRIINTGVRDSYYGIFEAVLGQMSDGIWENSRVVERYWKGVDLKKEGGKVIIILPPAYRYGNPYSNMEEDKIKRYFAQKIKQIIKEEINDNAFRGKSLGSLEWSRDSNSWSEYINAPVRDAYKVYDILMGRDHTDDKKVLLDAPEIHEELNPKLWKNEQLKETVAKRIFEVVDTFYDELYDLDLEIEELDVVLLGSNTAYNYYKEGSDLDIHIILKGSERDTERKLQEVLFQILARNFNRKYKVNFYGIPVELYVELDEFNKNVTSAYSLYDGWLLKPKRVRKEEYEEKSFEDEFKKWEKRYKSAIKGDLKEILTLIDEIYDLRKKSLEKSEYEIGNLIFKEFRKLGYLDELKNKQNELKGKKISLWTKKTN